MTQFGSQYPKKTEPYGNKRALFTDFIGAMRSAGILPSEPDRIDVDGQLHRFHVEGDKSGSRNGWAVLHVDRVACGAFGHWSTGRQSTWCSGDRERMTTAEQAQMDSAIAAAKRKRVTERLVLARAAQTRAMGLWAHAVAPVAHPYLIAKETRAYGIRQARKLLLVPLRDADGLLWNVQTIAPDGTKRFLSGGRKRGLYHAIGPSVAGLLCIAEGYATAASVHETTGHPVAVAFDCGNLEPVAKVLHAAYPQAIITICADNDLHTPGNPGLTKATIAARAVGGNVAIPPDGCNDFNDAMQGAQA